MTKAEEKALKVFGDLPNTPENQEKVADWIDGYEQAEKDTIERAAKWIEDTFFENHHCSGRGFYAQIETGEFDSMAELVKTFKKAMEK